MMTSKELLREFYYRCEHLCETDEQLAILNSAYQQIRNELEILEIVRNHKLLNYVIKNEKCAKMYCLTQEEINKLKEWL